MNPVEKLVRRIRAALGDIPDEATLQGLSREYARHCEDVNRRLEQCAEMLRHRNEYQALELAEANPPVLDLVTLLSFEEADDWRALCQKHKLPVPDSLDEKAIRKLNELYAKGIGANHPLYKQYREAMLSRDFPGSLQVLRSIAKLNPTDRNAKQELERLENKVLAMKMEKLKEPLECGIQDAIESIIADIESIPWTKPPRGPLWESAKQEQKKNNDRLATAESTRLLQQAETARDKGDWEQTREHLYAIQSRLQDRDAMLSPDFTEKMDSLNTWAQKQKEQANEIDRLSQWLSAWSEEKTTLSRLSGRRLRELHSELSHWFRESNPDAPPLTDDLKAPAEEALLALHRERQKRKKRRLLLQIAGCFIFVLAAAGTVFVLWGQSRINHAFSDIKTALADGNISGADARLRQMKQLEKWVPGAHTENTGDFQEFTGKVTEARQLREQFLAALLPIETRIRDGLSNDAFRDIAKDYENFHSLHGRLPVEYLDEFQSRSEKVDKAWNQFLEKVRQNSIDRLSQLITRSQDILEQKIDFKNDLSRVREGMLPLDKNAAEMEELLSPSMAGLRLPGDKIEEARKITLQVKPFREALDSLEKTAVKMRATASLEDYLMAVKIMADSPFTSARETEAALNLNRRNPTLDHLAAALLSPKFPNPPFPIQSISLSGLFPKSEPSEKERAIFLDLRDDPNLGEIYRSRISGNDSNSRWKGDTWVFARGEPKNKESRIDGEILKSEWKADVYDPVARPESAGFDSITLTYSFTSKPPSGTRIVEQVLSSDSDFFRRIGLADLVDPSGKYHDSVLKVLDTLRSDASLNPLFCAYVHSRLVALAAEQPDSWGLSLSPSLQRDHLEIEKVLTSETFSSDWMVPRRVQASGPRLKKLFDSSRSVSYLAEASLLSEYFKRISEAGFHFAGFVDETNTLQSNAEAQNALELWGWDDRDFTPWLLYQRASVNDPWHPVHPAAMLTPVFTCPIDREAAWNEAVRTQKIDADAPILSEYRPPFSRKNYER